MGEEHDAQCAHSDEEVSSIVLHVSNGMSEEKNGEEEGETAAAKETEEISNPKTHRGEKKHTQRRETAPERSEQMLKINVSETKKRMK